MAKLAPAVRNYLLDPPQSQIEKYNAGQEVKLGDTVKDQDFIYVMKGALEVHLRNDLGTIDDGDDGEMSPGRSQTIS